MVQAPSGPPRRLEWIIGILLGSLGCAMALLWWMSSSRPGKTIEAPSPGQGRAGNLPSLFSIGGFVLTNQHHRPFSHETLRGKVWVADLIFTRCASSCEVMSRKMAELQAEFRNDPRVHLVSVTADPAFDRPEVLLAYGERHGADFDRWTFLTGGQGEVYRLVTQGLKLVVVDKSDQPRQPEEEMFLHSVQFVLVDAEGRARGFYEITETGALEQLKRDVRALLPGGP